MMSELNWDWLKHPAVIWLSKQGNNIYMIREIKCFLNDSLKKQLTQAKKPKKKKAVIQIYTKSKVFRQKSYKCGLHLRILSCY